MREERGGAGKGPRQNGEGGGAGQGRGRSGFGGPARGPAAGPERSRGYGGGPAGREARDGGDEVRTGPPEDLIYGRNPVLEALRKGRPITRVWLAKESKDRVGAEAAALCHQANIPFKYVDRPFLDHLCWNGLHQGLAAQAAPKEYVEWESMLELAKAKGQQPLLVILDEVEDPHNLGAILRSADALGAQSVCGAQDRAQVMRILHLVKNHQKRLLALGLRQLQHALPLHVFLGGRLGRQTLMQSIPAQMVQKGPVHVFKRDIGLMAKGRRFRSDPVLAFLREPHPGNGPALPQGLQHRISAVNQILRRSGPDLVPAIPGLPSGRAAAIAPAPFRARRRAPGRAAEAAPAPSLAGSAALAVLPRPLAGAASLLTHALPLLPGGPAPKAGAAFPRPFSKTDSRSGIQSRCSCGIPGAGRFWRAGTWRSCPGA